MANRKYPPRGDEETLAAAEQFETNVGDPKDIALTADDIAALTDELADAVAAVKTHKASQAKARADRIAKDAKVKKIEERLSEFNRRIQPMKSVSDERRAQLGLPVYDKTPTTAETPDELPIVQIDASLPLTHEISYSGENTKGKPEGVTSFEIRVKVGGNATGDEKDYQYQTNDTESPYTKQFSAADAGKQAHYLFCWVNSKGERGPWKMMSATITSELQSGTV